jgi:hypothetical protein
MNFNNIVDSICVAFSFCFILYTIFTTVTRHLTERSHNNLQMKVFDKLNSTPAIGELVATGALQPFLASLTQEKVAQTTPALRILRGIQLGVVLTCFGAAMLVLHQALRSLDYGVGFLTFGIGALGLGLGFIIAALTSVWLSRKLGLLDRDTAREPLA